MEMNEEIMFETNYGETRQESFIRVIGVGGAGSNAVEHMFKEGIVGVDFVICNTDRMALESKSVPTKLVLGSTGLGSGSNPEEAERLALDSEDKIRDLIGENTKMLFITAGMGKGTGTGAAPVVAKIAREMGILTIAVVTYPYRMEGAKNARKADAGVENLKKYVDSLIIIHNQKVMSEYGDKTIPEGLSIANDVLKNAVKCIAELITVEGDQNVDFNDVRTTMKDSGEAMIGIAEASGEDRISKVVSQALTCPLIDDSKIENAGNFLFYVRYGESRPATFAELEKMCDEFASYQGKEAEIIWGHSMDKSLGDKIQLSVIITNFGKDNNEPEKEEKPGVKIPQKDNFFPFDPVSPMQPGTSASRIGKPNNTFEFPADPEIPVQNQKSEASQTPAPTPTPAPVQPINKSNEKIAYPFNTPAQPEAVKVPSDTVAPEAESDFNPFEVPAQPAPKKDLLNPNIQISDNDRNEIYEDDEKFKNFVETPAHERVQKEHASSLQQIRTQQFVQPAQMPQANYSGNFFFNVVPSVD
ncbi:MAG: cell division protein FtsZ [Bacteroidales bacterium]|nr:cell division protein FtsZ [Bacteroidales bacterium]